jgi:hypothetical protein
MRLIDVEEDAVRRRDVITFYVDYDRRKKKRYPITGLDAWPWDSADALDERLASYDLKRGVLAVYRDFTVPSV